MRSFCLVIILFFIINNCFSQGGNTLLMGTVSKAERNYLELNIDKTWLDNSMLTELVGINAEGKFGISLQLELAQTITLHYNGKQVVLFLAPADTLFVDFDAAKFPYSLHFSGAAAAENDCLRRYQEEFPEDLDLFHFRQYPRNSYYYKIHEAEDELMRSKNPEVFLQELRREQLKKEDFLQQFDQKAALDQSFKNYFLGNSLYKRLYAQLAYGHIYKGRHRLDSSYFHFADSLPNFNDGALGHRQYREWLLAWVNYRCEGSAMADSIKTEYAKQYYFTKEHLEGISRYWVMAQLVATAFRKEAPEKALPIYKDFLLSNPYMELDRIASDAFQRSKQFAAGSPAPTFSLQDIDDNWLSLRDLQGKLVYLDFWASWCRPCINKMQAMKTLYPIFEGKDIVFLHVNLDKSPEIWKNIVKEQGFGGIQLYNNSDASITQDYEVLAVPKFFVISKDGNFAFAPAGNVEKLAETLLKLLK